MPAKQDFSEFKFETSVDWLFLLPSPPAAVALRTWCGTECWGLKNWSRRRTRTWSSEFSWRSETHENEICFRKQNSVGWFPLTSSDPHSVFPQCDGVPMSLPSLQGLAVLNIPSYAGGINFWGGTKEDNVSVVSALCIHTQNVSVSELFLLPSLSLLT